MNPLAARLIRIVAAACLAISGYLHAYLYDHGYRAIHRIGVAFLLQASASFAIALLLPFTGLVLLRMVGAGLAGGALIAFLMSRTVGVFGFVEHGLQPSPQALISVIVEIAALGALAQPAVAPLWSMARRPAALTTTQIGDL